MSRGNYKPFDPADIDSSLTRVIVHEPGTFLVFPYIDGRGSEPKFTSVSVVIRAEAATAKDLAALAERIKLAAQNAPGAQWYLNFNTAWLLDSRRVEESKNSTAGRRPNRT